ncbi:glyoxylase-like metal-dependent hydrolase (beta-lactamase superfamily II) [Myroides gitamensis]|uniref:MBL fold metallo-hydrolase n=1 Tax=Myroides odoratus TaxID=256 RepID=UPI0021691EF7|nr:MBL fold metallo-hydrolase [Myroides odoratus]MCS4239494.1 glyoxylase-like metal-dependent hydrolase (beta-lactamase superfamily II) [Myroides odoratus]MDH6601341.1 glyoxylase-like metal-dependent hydrolase (beta-lactamase superfamily II) [Myroides gitamensis]
MKILNFTIEQEVAGQISTIYPTVIKTENEVVLVDCGYEETFDQFKVELAKLGIPLTAITKIIISHDDIDHLGALPLFVAENPDIQVYCSTIEKSAVTGETKSERLEQAEASLQQLPVEYRAWAENFIIRLNKIKRIPVDHTLEEGDYVVEEVEVIHTPGHTKGHISLFDHKTKTLIANDALVIEEDRLNIANPQFTLDMRQAVASLKKIKQLQPAKIICYHGGSMEEGIQEQLEVVIQYYQ